MNYFIESSAKTGFNAEKIFVQAAKLLYTEFKEIAKINFTWIRFQIIQLISFFEVPHSSSESSQ